MLLPENLTDTPSQAKVNIRDAKDTARARPLDLLPRAIWFRTFRSLLSVASPTATRPKAHDMRGWNEGKSTIGQVRTEVMARFGLRIEVVDPSSRGGSPTFIPGQSRLERIPGLAERVGPGLEMPSLSPTMTVQDAERRFRESWGVDVEILVVGRGPRRARDSARLSSVGFREVAISAPEPATPSVFISYRRESGGLYAQLVNEFLEGRKIPTTLDVSTLKAGLFGPQLEARIRHSTRFLLVCTPGIFRDFAETTEKDWIRSEIEIALRHRRTIIPFTTPDFEWPSERDLPTEFRHLRGYQEFRYRHETWATEKEDFLRRFVDTR